MNWAGLASLKLTIPLLLALAVAAVFGTFAPVEQGRYELFYQSLWFRLLLAALALNLTACTWKTLGRQRRLPEGLRQAWDGERLAQEGRRLCAAGPTALEVAAERLTRRGYRVRCEAGLLLASRFLWGRWGSTLVHLSLLVIMAGALLGGAGFVGTQQLLVGHSSASYFDWDAQADRPLGFELRLDHFEPIHYPIQVRFAVHEADSGQLLGTLTGQEGEVVPLPLPGYTARLERFIPIEKRLVLRLYREGVDLGPYDAFPLGNREASRPVFGMTLHPDAFKDPILKQLHSEVSILRDGQVLKQGVIEVNQPLVFEGVTIYQTAFNQDPFGFWYAGFQLSKDPGEPLVWFGCLVLTAGFILAFAARPRVLALAVTAGELWAAPLLGFTGEAGETELNRLLDGLGD